ncbi:MAG TPA: ClpXP protease specificity-enhancing factor SspB [Polyangiaceae bacterium]|nr:ClpXP protease specificity-enhancing factor SspB [Polyangiaceae bacterium]
MPPLPRKQAVALDLLERTSVFVHLDPRRPGVIVPQGFLKQPQLVLQIGLNMAIAIPDLNVGEEGISCTLSFNKRPHFCSLPWSSIYALIGEQGGGMVWPEDVPPEVVSQQRAAAKKDAKPRKPGLRAISGSGGAAAGADSDRAGGEAADRSADDADVPSTRRSDTPRPAELRPADIRSGEARSGDVRPAEVRRGEVRSSTPRPPRLVQVVSNPARSESAPVSQAAEDTSQPNEAPARDDQARPPATKRSRPPYLRLVD